MHLNHVIQYIINFSPLAYVMISEKTSDKVILLFLFFVEFKAIFILKFKATRNACPNLHIVTGVLKIIFPPIGNSHNPKITYNLVVQNKNLSINLKHNTVIIIDNTRCTLSLIDHIQIHCLSQGRNDII